MGEGNRKRRGESSPVLLQLTVHGESRHWTGDNGSNASCLDRLKPAPNGAVNVKGRVIARCQGCGISATCEMMQRGATTPRRAKRDGGAVARLRMNYARMKFEEGRLQNV